MLPRNHPAMRQCKKAFLIFLFLMSVLILSYNNILKVSNLRFTIQNKLTHLSDVVHAQQNYHGDIGTRKNDSFLIKFQNFLSSLPSEDKNSSQFHSVQNHLDRLFAQTISRLKGNSARHGVTAELKNSDLNHYEDIKSERINNDERQRTDIYNAKQTTSEKDAKNADTSKYYPNTDHDANEDMGKEDGSEGQKDKTTTKTNRDFPIAAKDLSAQKNYCDTNKYLKGKQIIKATVNEEEVKDPEALKRVRKGGSYVPETCRPRDSVAVIIPYRDRQKHLEIFVNYMHSFLQRQQLQYGIFVVELARPTTFNRGLLANVGITAAQSTGLYNCYVIHDVDLLPINDKNIYNCSDQFRHLSVANSKFNNGLPYQDYAGGVIAIREDTFVNINGFSNLYFGWGGEDDDVWNRAKAENYHLERPSVDDGIYVALPHGQDPLNQINPERFNLLYKFASRRLNDGLNSLNYEQLSLTEQDLYTLVYVRVNMTEVLQTKLVGHFGEIDIYESDLQTLRNNRVVNDKIINAYFRTLQGKNNGQILSMKTTFKFGKKPWFPVELNTRQPEFLFLPMKHKGHWTLRVIFYKEQSITCIDPFGDDDNVNTDLIRSEYRNQFGVVLVVKTDEQQSITLNTDKNNSGILIMMYAKKIVEKKPLSFDQTEIYVARKEIEETLRR